ncbi:MAG: glycosyltransferase family 4 protein [Nitrospirota bacterium]
MNIKVAIIFHHLGPYHVARIKSLLAKIPRLTVIELASRASDRSWARPDTDGFQLITLVNDTYENVSPHKFVKSMEEALRKCDPECLVICGYAHPAMRAAARWAKNSAGIGTVLLSESQHVDQKRNTLKEYVKGLWIRKYCDAAFVGGASAASYLQHMGFPRERIWRGYNVVDNAYFESGAEAIRTNMKDIQNELGLPLRYFLYVGRFSEEKNLIRLLKAYKSYLSGKGEKAWGLVMAGSGPQERELRTTADSLGLKDICWPGFVQIDDLPKYYAFASGFILPSIREPWGLVVNEAMAAGLPVLVSVNCGCVLDLVVPGVNGKLFDPYSEADIAGALNWLSSGEIDLNALGKASKSLVSHCSLEHWAASLEDCITALSRNSK